MSSIEDIFRNELGGIVHKVDIALEGLCYDLTRPHVLYKPKLYPDGNQWCALLGDNIMEGVVGFGSSPEKAMSAFDSAFFKDMEVAE